MRSPRLPSLDRVFARPPGDASRVVLARVESIPVSKGRRRWRLHATSFGEDDRELDPSMLSLLSLAGREPVPLRVLAVDHRGSTLVIEAEQLQPFTSGSDPSALLVALRERVAKVEPSEPIPGAQSDIDYLARDFNSFRTLLLNHISAFAPSWTDRSPADLGVMVSEVLAYLADDLTYFQDAVSTEAYLTTARRELSVRRHARLLAYWLDQGVGARAWVRFDARTSVTIPRGTQLFAGGGRQPIVQVGTMQYQQQRTRGTAVFETMVDLQVHPGLRVIEIADEGRRNFVLPAGATSVAVLDVELGTGSLELGDLLPGYLLLVDPNTSGTSGTTAPHPVRIRTSKRRDDGTVLLGWDTSDALPTDFVVTRTVAGIRESRLTVLRGNLILADFGESATSVLPARSDVDEPWQLTLPVPIVPLAAGGSGPAVPASLGTTLSPEQVRPAIELLEYRDLSQLGGTRSGRDPRSGEAEVGSSSRLAKRSDGSPTRWRPVPDLLLSGPFSTTFVVENQDQGCLLRFGDGVFGRPPAFGSAFVARYRMGDPADSNVGVGSIATIVAPAPNGELAPFVSWSEALLRVSNPIAASSGRAAETLAHAKTSAPPTAQTIHAAITLADYAVIARRVTGVADVATLLRWTGSWFTTFVHVRVDEGEPATRVLTAVEHALALARVAGRTIVVRAPTWVALSVELRITLASGFGSEGVHEALRVAFLAAPTATCQAGFFHVSRWRFGDSVWASAIVTWAEGVRGVAAAELVELARASDSSEDRLEPSTPRRSPPIALKLAGDQLPQLLDEPFAPQTGRLVFTLIDPDDEVWT